MIWLSQELYFLCILHTAHPTLFIENGECVLMCGANDMPPHPCYDADGHSLTDCFDENHQSQLCDAFWTEITADDYEVTHD